MNGRPYSVPALRPATKARKPFSDVCRGWLACAQLCLVVRAAGSSVSSLGTEHFKFRRCLFTRWPPLGRQVWMNANVLSGDEAGTFGVSYTVCSCGVFSLPTETNCVCPGASVGNAHGTDYTKTLTPQNCALHAKIKYKIGRSFRIRCLRRR